MIPLIFDYLEKRSEPITEVSYKYDFRKMLNVVHTSHGNVPFIDLNSSLLDVATKTKTHRENDDFHSTIELQTKTEVSRERDEQADNLLQFVTKTRTRRESDDEHF